MFSLKTVTKTRLNYILANRISKEIHPLDEDRYVIIIMNNKECFKVIYYNKLIIGVIGFLPSSVDHMLNGYLILTNSYMQCVLSGFRVFNNMLSKFKSSIRFYKHHDDKQINRWYSILGFKLEDNYWVRRI